MYVNIVYHHSLSDADHSWTFSSKKGISHRQKRESTDYRIEMLFVIDFSIYN